jgi:hypothetical protein
MAAVAAHNYNNRLVINSLAVSPLGIFRTAFGTVSHRMILHPFRCVRIRFCIL